LIVNPQVYLNQHEVNLCQTKAKERQANRERSGSIDLAPKDLDPLQLNLIGMFGEIAVHRYLDIPIDWYKIGANEFTGDSDVSGMIEVRTTTAKPYRPNGTELDLRQRDLSDQRMRKTLTSCWIKVVVKLQPEKDPKCTLLGWSMGYEILAHNILQARRKGVGFCVYQPDSKLNSMLPSLIFKERIKTLQTIANQTYEAHI